MSFTRPDTVYFIKPVGHDGPIKVGCSCEPVGRLADLSVWSPLPLEIIATVPGSYSDESFLHKCFADDHSHGEWFRSSPKLTETITKIIAIGSLDWAKQNLKPRGSIKARKYPKSEDRSLHLSYSHRIRWAVKKLRVDTDAEIVIYSEPSDVDAIMSRWYGHPRKGIARQRPTPEEFARIERFLANPSADATPHRIPMLRKKPAITPSSEAGAGA